MKSFITGLTVVLVLIVVSVSCRAQDSEPAVPPSERLSAQLPSPATQPAAPQPKPTHTTPQGAAVNETGAATKAFLDRLQEYVTFHNNVEKMVPALKETSDPAKLSEREKALGAALIKQRPDAKPGDFFIKEYQPILTQLIRDDFLKRPLADRKALIVELPKGIKLGVNMIYPTSLPLPTFPANLLEKLPKLPPELEYRMVGRDLILRDTTGNVIVDVLPNVFPIPT
jgi:hypothetical protein